jgi:chromosome segregation ATPase
MSTKRKAEDTCSDLIEDLQARISALEAEVMSKSEDLEELDDQVSDLVSERNELESANTSLTNTAEELQAKCDEQEEAIQEKNDEIQEKTDECVDLQLQLEEAQNEDSRKERRMFWVDTQIDRYLAVLKEKLGYVICIDCGAAWDKDTVTDVGRCFECN